MGVWAGGRCHGQGRQPSLLLQPTRSGSPSCGVGLRRQAPVPPSLGCTSRHGSRLPTGGPIRKAGCSPRSHSGSSSGAQVVTEGCVLRQAQRCCDGTRGTSKGGMDPHHTGHAVAGAQQGIGAGWRARRNWVSRAGSELRRGSSDGPSGGYTRCTAPSHRKGRCRMNAPRL